MYVSNPQTAPHILGIGGSGRPGSASMRLLELGLELAAAGGATAEILDVAALGLPGYAADMPYSGPEAQAFTDAVRRADGLLISTPGYHGGPSGVIKNALEYVEELRSDARPYLDGRAVGVIVTAAGLQASVSALIAMRSTVHALRGWPTPLGVPVNTAETPDPATDPSVMRRVAILTGQVVEFAENWRS